MSDTQRMWDEIRQKVRVAVSLDVLSGGLETEAWASALMEGVEDKPANEQINILAATVGITTRMITLIFNCWATTTERPVEDLLSIVWSLMAEQESGG